MQDLLNSTPAGRTTPRYRAFLAEYAIPIALTISLLVTCVIVSQKKALWSDEVASAMFIREHSLIEQVRKLAIPADAGPPLYYVLGWIWGKILGTGTTTLRLLSAVSVAGAVWFVWCALRRGYSRLATASGIVLAVTTSQLFLYHVSELRFYGLLIGLVAFAYYVYVRIGSAPRPRTRDLILQVVASSALVYCHISGWFYSGALLAAYLVVDFRTRKFRPLVYASIVAGWCTFILWVPAFIRQAGLGKPHSNLRPPTITELIALYQFEAYLLPTLLLALVVLIALSRRFGTASGIDGVIVADEPISATRDDSRFVALVGGVALFAVPAVVFVASRLIAPMLLPRYVVPSVLGVAVIIAELVALTGVSLRLTARVVRAVWMVMLAGLVVYPILRARAMPPAPVPGRAELLSVVPPGVPIAVDEAYYYSPLNYPDTLPANEVYYLRDWQTAIDPANEQAVTSIDRLMSVWQQIGYVNHAVPLPAFVCTRDVWAMLHTPGFLLFDRRIASDSAFTTRTLGSHGGNPIILVERKPGRTPKVCEARDDRKYSPPSGPGAPD